MATGSGDSTEVQVVDLELPDGHVPFRDWYNRIRDRKVRALIQNRIDRFLEGNFGDCKSVGKEVFEMRIFYGPGYRVYFAKVGAIIVVLLGGGDKSTQDKDISAAQALWKDNKDLANDAITRPS